MKDQLIPIDPAGRIVLPKNVREELAVKPGDYFKVSVHGNAVTLTPEKEEAGFVRRGKALVFSASTAETLTNEAVTAFRREDDDEMRARVERGLPARKRRS